MRIKWSIVRCVVVFVIIWGVMFEYLCEDHIASRAVSDEDRYEKLELMSLDEMYIMNFKITEILENTYYAHVSLENVSCEYVQGWEICIQYSDSIVNVKKAQIVDQNSKHKIIRGKENYDIKADSSVEFDIEAKYSEKPVLPKTFYSTKKIKKIKKGDYSISYAERKSDGKLIDIKIKNKSKKTIHKWRVDIYFDKKSVKIISVKNAKLLGRYKGCVQLINLKKNSDLLPNMSISVRIKKNNKSQIIDNVLYKEEKQVIDDTVMPFDDIDAENYNAELNPVVSTVKEKAEKAVFPNVETEIIIDNYVDKAYAIQNYCFDGYGLSTIFRKKDISVDDAYITKSAKMNGPSLYLVNQSDTFMLDGFSHGQTFELIGKGDKKTYMLCSGNGSQGWSGNVSFIRKSKIIKEKGPIHYNDKRIKRIIGIGDVSSSSRGAKRIDAAASADGKHIVVWYCPISSKIRNLIVLDQKKVIDYLYNGKHSILNLLSEKLKREMIVNYAEGTESLLQPNGSFQSIEISNYKKKKKCWDIYITSGNEKVNGKMIIAKYNLTNKGRIMDCRQITVKCPVVDNNPIIDGHCEIEGCHIKGDRLFFLICPSSNDKSRQFLVSLKLAQINNGNKI